MKTKKTLILTLYWLFRIGFIFQVLAIVSHYYLVFTMPYSEAATMVYSDVRIFRDSNSVASIPVATMDTLVHPKIFQLPHARSSMIYDSYRKLDVTAWCVFILNFAYHLVWLVFTWELLKVFQSLKENRIFDIRNIWRLRIVALTVGLSPVLALLRNLIYPILLQKNAVLLPHHRVVYYYDYSMFEGLFYMVIILLIIEIFKYGISLQQEQDLII